MQIVKESVNILLEAVPRHVQLEEVIDLMKKALSVEDVHDIHIWTTTSGVHALSAHLVIEEQAVSKSAEIVARVNQDLAKHFNVTHSTLQLECETCPTGVVCDVSQPENRK